MKKLIALIFLSVICTGCTFFRPHKLDIQQGNVITQNEVDRLHNGMSPSQVKRIMGHPVMVTIFEKHRLNYIYTLKRGYNPMQAKQVICEFKNGSLVNVHKS